MDQLLHTTPDVPHASDLSIDSLGNASTRRCSAACGAKLGRSAHPVRSARTSAGNPQTFPRFPVARTTRAAHHSKNQPYSLRVVKSPQVGLIGFGGWGLIVGFGALPAGLVLGEAPELEFALELLFTMCGTALVGIGCSTSLPL